jgi:hypothetical protein
MKVWRYREKMTPATKTRPGSTVVRLKNALTWLAKAGGPA